MENNIPQQNLWDKIKFYWALYKKKKQEILDWGDEIDEWMYENIPLWLGVLINAFFTITFVAIPLDGTLVVPDESTLKPFFVALPWCIEHWWEIWEYTEIIGECYFHPWFTWDAFVADQCMPWERDWAWDTI